MWNVSGWLHVLGAWDFAGGIVVHAIAGMAALASVLYVGKRKIIDSKEEYHDWIKQNKQFLFPNKVNKSVAYDVKVNPLKYIQYSIYINSKIVGGIPKIIYL